MNGRYNTRSPAVKRLMREAQELSEPTDQYFAQPLDDNLFEWHFTVRGPADSDFQNGIYHGRIILPVDYPMKPPSIIWLTPNGRFETNKKICLSISGHHPESWQPSWSIRTALLAIIGFMPTHPGGAIGSLDYTPDERKVMAKKSKDWKCPTCGDVTGILLEVSANSAGTSKEAKELAAQINLQGEKPKCKEGECPVEQARLAEIQASRADPAPGSQTENSTTSQGVPTTPTTCNNNTTSTPFVQQGPPLLQSSSPSVVPPQTSFPQFPQWSPGAGPFPMPPIGFPYMQYPGMPPMQPMQFPYPPSHYSAIPQSSWPMPMYPGFLPPSLPSSHFPSPTVSTNNSSNEDKDGTNPVDNNMSSNSQYTRTPMTTSLPTNRSPPVASTNETSAESPNVGQDVQSQEKKQDVLKELLNKVKRAGSESKFPQGASLSAADVLEEIPETSSNIPEQSADSDTKILASKSEDDGDQHRLGLETSVKKVLDGATDSEVSHSLKKTGDISVSEAGDTNTEDNSESGVPPIEMHEVDQHSIFDKGACSSMSELEKWKQRYQMSKGLRQRQSATAGVPVEATEEATVEAQQRPEASTTRQRIEAASGDTGLRNRPRIGAARPGNNLNVLNLPNNVRQNEERSRDVSFYIMAGLLTTSIVILLNRLMMVVWL